jgi:hypothetical protein
MGPDPKTGAHSTRADDEARTRDLNLGKVALYQLSYVRVLPTGFHRSARPTLYLIVSDAS